jgi:Flp pilus assembly protein TadD
MDRKFKRATGVLALFLFAASNVSAQRTGSATSTSTTTTSGTGSIEVRVSGDDGQPLDISAEVRVYPGGGGAGAITLMTADGGRATFNALSQGEYAVEASAPGYKTGSGGSVNVEGRGITYTVDVRLERDTSSTDSPFSTAGPILAPKAQKAEDKGVAALKAGKLADAQEDLEETLKLAPANPNANFLLGYIYLQEKDLVQSETYLMKAYYLDPKYVQTLVSLGQLRFEQKDYAKATEMLKAALTVDPNQWFALWILADTDLRQQDFDDARKEALLAVQMGKGSANGAQLIVGEALADQGRKDEAIQALELFVRNAPKNSSVPQAQALIATLKGGGAQPASAAPAETPAASPSGASAPAPAQSATP